MSITLEVSEKELTMILDSIELNAAVCRQKGLTEMIAFVNDEVLEYANELNELQERLTDLAESTAELVD